MPLGGFKKVQYSRCRDTRKLQHVYEYVSSTFLYILKAYAAPIDSESLYDTAASTHRLYRACIADAEGARKERDSQLACVIKRQERTQLSTLQAPR